MIDDKTPQQVETIRILASIQTTNEFILKGMGELKSEMGKVAEVIQAHAIVLQAHSADINHAKQVAEDASDIVEDLKTRVAVLEAAPAPKSHWSTDNVKAVTVYGSVLYGLIEIARWALSKHP